VAINIIADPDWDEGRFAFVRDWAMSVPEIVREAEYLLPPPADRPSAAPGRKKLYVHVPARRRA